MPFIYIPGTGGLGNTLFQLSAGIYYAEKYGHPIRMIRTHATTSGTSDQFERKQSYPLDYEHTIFKQLQFLFCSKVGLKMQTKVDKALENIAP